MVVIRCENLLGVLFIFFHFLFFPDDFKEKENFACSILSCLRTLEVHCWKWLVDYYAALCQRTNICDNYSFCTSASKTFHFCKRNESTNV